MDRPSSRSTWAKTEVRRLHRAFEMRLSTDAKLSFAAIDFDALVGRAIDTTMRREPIARIECQGLDEREAVVVGDRSRLEETFSALLLACVRRTRRGGAVRVALRRELGAWEVHIEHPTSLVRDHGGAMNLDGELDFARAVMDAHAGTVSAFDDTSRGVYVLRVSLPAPAPPIGDEAAAALH